MSKRKGDGFERELAAYLTTQLGLPVHRAPLSGGGLVGLPGMADLIGTPHLHIEAKRTERFSPYPAMAQAERSLANTGAPEVPLVISRRNNMATADSLAVMRLRDFLIFYTYYLEHPAQPPSSQAA